MQLEMKNTATKPSVSTNKKKITGTVIKAKPDAAKGLRDLLVVELKDIYWAEKEMVKALPKMVKNASSEELVNALASHLEATKTHVTRLEKVFASLGEKAVAKKCEAIAGLLEEGKEIMEETAKGAVRDAGIILAAQKVEHYEIATYGTLRIFARTIGETSAATFLESTLEEEKEADVLMTVIAEASINVEAAGKNGDSRAKSSDKSKRK